MYYAEVEKGDDLRISEILFQKKSLCVSWWRY